MKSAPTVVAEARRCPFSILSYQHYYFTEELDLLERRWVGLEGRRRDNSGCSVGDLRLFLLGLRQGSSTILTKFLVARRVLVDGAG